MSITTRRRRRRRMCIFYISRHRLRARRGKTDGRAYIPSTRSPSRTPPAVPVPSLIAHCCYARCHRASQTVIRSPAMMPPASATQLPRAQISRTQIPRRRHNVARRPARPGPSGPPTMPRSPGVMLSAINERHDRSPAELNDDEADVAITAAAATDDRSTIIHNTRQGLRST